MTTLADLDWAVEHGQEMVRYEPGHFPLFKTLPTDREKIEGWYFVEKYFVINNGRYVTMAVDKSLFNDVVIDILAFTWQELEAAVRKP